MIYNKGKTHTYNVYLAILAILLLNIARYPQVTDSRRECPCGRKDKESGDLTGFA